MNITTLSQFQYESLRDAANSSIAMYLLMRPNVFDGAENFLEWSSNNLDTDALVKMGLMEELTGKYADRIEAEARASGRLFRVIKITEIGKAMFNESCPSASC